jgi:hypothetical protein
MKKDFEEWWASLDKGRTGYKNDMLLYRWEKDVAWTVWKNCIRYYKNKRVGK